MIWNPITFLQGLHTRQLMNLRKRVYRVNGGLNREYFDRTMRDEEMHYDVLGDSSGCVINMAQLKAELATREHVPNKSEAKAIRQAKAHAQRNR